VLVGVHVRSQLASDPQATQLFGIDTPDLYVPRLAAVYFRVREGGRNSWLGPFDVKTTDAYIPVPFDVYAVAYRIAEEPGFQSVGTAVFRIRGEVPT